MPKIKVPYIHPTETTSYKIGFISFFIFIFLVYSSIIGLIIWGIVKLIKYLKKKKEKFNQYRSSSRFPKKTASLDQSTEVNRYVLD